MRPDELSDALRRIASGIENSKNPSRELVARDLKRMLGMTAIAAEETLEDLKDHYELVRNRLEEIEKEDEDDHRIKGMYKKLEALRSKINKLKKSS